VTNKNARNDKKHQPMKADSWSFFDSGSAVERHTRIDHCLQRQIVPAQDSVPVDTRQFNPILNQWHCIHSYEKNTLLLQPGVICIEAKAQLLFFFHAICFKFFNIENWISYNSEFNMTDRDNLKVIVWIHTALASHMKVLDERDQWRIQGGHGHPKLSVSLVYIRDVMLLPH